MQSIEYESMVKVCNRAIGIAEQLDYSWKETLTYLKFALDEFVNDGTEPTIEQANKASKK